MWDEENRLECVQEHDRDDTVRQDPSACDKHGPDPTVRFVYDDAGNRVVKDGHETHISPNRNFSQVNGQSFKHVFVGDNRLLTKRVENEHAFENHQFYFHADHLGSSNFVTDERGKLTAHQEFFAFGETWVDESPSEPVPVPYQYNGKEFDEETGLYYYGARYYNPRTYLWQSPDPMLGSYLDGSPNGGVYRSSNLAPYTYTYNNPVRLVDPAGKAPEEKWLEEYEAAIDDLPAKYEARRVLTDPNIGINNIASDIVGSLADHRFCERVGADACSGGAFEYISGMTTAATKEATDRQLSRGWSELLKSNLSASEQQAYRDDLNNKRWGESRRWLGTALHNAVARDLEGAQGSPDNKPRFEYNRSRGPDFLDRKTGVKVELTTPRGLIPHILRGGAYLRSPYVIYRQPGRLPSIMLRGGNR